IEGVIASSGNNSPGKFVAAAPIGFGQLGKVRLPAQLDCSACAKIMCRSPRRENHRRKNRHEDSEEQRQEDDVSNRPMESINPRKHLCFLLLAARTAVDSDRKESRR